MANEGVFLGRMSGPSTSTIGNVAVWADTSGSLLADGGGGGAFVASVAGTSGQVLVNGGTTAATGAVTVSLAATVTGIDSITGSGGQSLVMSTADNTDLYRGTNAQSLHIYNTYTNATTYERLSMLWGGNQATIYTNANGGAGRQLNVGTRGNSPMAVIINNGNRWIFASSGDSYSIYPADNNSRDIGIVSTNEIRSLFAGTSVVSPVFKTSTALITATDGGSTAAFTANMVGSTGGPTTAAQNGWQKFQDSSGATVWVPVWK